MGAKALLLTILLHVPGLFPQAGPDSEAAPTGAIVPITHCPLPTIITGTSQGPAPVVISGAGAVPAGQALKPGPAAEKKEAESIENLIAFNPDQLSLEWSLSNWQLRAGKVLLKDFGRNENAARLMLQALRELRLTQYGTVGSPKPVLEYFLSEGKAPCGLASGLRVFPLDQRSLRVERTYAQWCVRDAYHLLLNFESNEEDARNALVILRKYHFTQVGAIGSTNPPLLIFLTRPGDEVVGNPGQQGLSGAGQTAKVLPTVGQGMTVPPEPVKGQGWLPGFFGPKQSH